MFAKVARDLNQSLLRGSASQRAAPPNAQQTLARQFQNGIVLRLRPDGMAVFNDPLEFSIFAFGGACPKPRQNHIHRQIRHPRIAQQRLRLFQPRRAERPVPRPKFVAFHFQDFPQRINQLGRADLVSAGRPGRCWQRGPAIRNFRGAPIFEF